MPATVQQLCEAIERYRLMPSRDLSGMRTRWFRPGRKEVDDVAYFCNWLVVNRYLTRFMVRVLAKGRAEQLLLNDYQLRDQIAEGPFAGGYLAADPLRQNVVIEVLAAGNAADPRMLERFQSAARKVSAVHHPNVGRTIDFGQARGLHYLVKKFYKGETVAEVLRRRGKLSAHRAARLFALALAGLDALHQQGVSGGDLTADCLLLTSASSRSGGGRTVKILHAGLRRRLFDDRAIGKKVPAVDAEEPELPEEIGLASSFCIVPDDTSAINPEVDLFHLGCVFYQALTGKTPFAADQVEKPSAPAVPVAQLAPEVPEMVGQLVDQMIDPDPGRRPRKASAAAKSLRIFLAVEEEGGAVKPEEDLVLPRNPAGQTEEVGEGEGDEAEELAEPKEPRAGGKPAANITAEAGDEPRSKFEDFWEEIKPRERDYVFLGVGAAAIVVGVLFLQLLTGFRFINLICLVTGAAVSYFVEKLIRWQLGPGEAVPED